MKNIVCSKLAAWVHQGRIHFSRLSFEAGLMRLSNEKSGNFGIMSAILIPIVLFGGIQFFSLHYMVSKKTELANITRLACNRALKPTRTTMYDDTERAAFGLKAFDEAASASRMKIVARSVDVKWLDVTVKATAKVSTVGVLDKSPEYTIETSENCKGIPPYPALGDVILSSNFQRVDGSPFILPWGGGSTPWFVFSHTVFGWDDSTGTGIEIQDWGPGGFGQLPKGVSSTYVVELDSWSNSSVSKIVELHRGTYRFSFWYIGRTEDAGTNGISVYLEGVRPASKPVQKLLIAEPRSAGWMYKSFEIVVPEYSVYKFKLQAEGRSDGLGGHFNDLKLEYIKRPSPEYADG